jgi:hypothetical protein
MSDRRFVAESDCERIRSGPVSQPVNTVTSLAYVVAGAWAARRGHRWLGVALAVNGIGSVAYHGPGGPVAKVLHDGGIVAAALAGAGEAMAAGPPRRVDGRRLVLGSALLGAGVLVHTRSRTGGPWCRPDSLLQGHGLWHVLSAAGVAVLADAASST